MHIAVQFSGLCSILLQRRLRWSEYLCFKTRPGHKYLISIVICRTINIFSLFFSIASSKAKCIKTLYIVPLPCLQHVLEKWQCELSPLVRYMYSSPSQRTPVHLNLPHSLVAYLSNSHSLIYMRVNLRRTFSHKQIFFLIYWVFKMIEENYVDRQWILNKSDFKCEKGKCHTNLPKGWSVKLFLLYNTLPSLQSFMNS